MWLYLSIARYNFIEWLLTKLEYSLFKTKCEQIEHTCCTIAATEWGFFANTTSSWCRDRVFNRHCGSVRRRPVQASGVIFYPPGRGDDVNDLLGWHLSDGRPLHNAVTFCPGSITKTRITRLRPWRDADGIRLVDVQWTQIKSQSGKSGGQCVISSCSSCTVELALKSQQHQRQLLCDQEVQWKVLK